MAQKLSSALHEIWIIAVYSVICFCWCEWWTTINCVHFNMLQLRSQVCWLFARMFDDIAERHAGYFSFDWKFLSVSNFKCTHLIFVRNLWVLLWFVLALHTFGRISSAVTTGFCIEVAINHVQWREATLNWHWHYSSDVEIRDVLTESVDVSFHIMSRSFPGLQIFASGFNTIWLVDK